MRSKPNLRFLLALGSRKMVVLQESETLDVYSDQAPSRTKNPVNAQRIAEALAIPTSVN